MLVLLDRDGVLNEDRPDYVRSPAELRMLPGAVEGVRRLTEAGARVAVVTNQACVGKGIVSPSMLEEIHRKLRETILAGGGRLDAIFACTDLPSSHSERRKPAPGMLIEAMRQFGCQPAETVMVGDALRDMEAAARVGCGRILVRTGKGIATQAAGLPREVLPVRVAEDLREAAEQILETAR
ncbi:D-glycero-alpha-D-manno-heptose-1,7-bisphosphate 7-phosphatase [Oceanibacterium hippocampi]|uniref:D,D-heptose 1,7-bisphosphate phosphatase n=1 Tax=Oceanibacterium hippocampi TaxID=745714 RepID=A0A1Y5RXJ8_9PROT|nr:HAD-IIIA family hydrolase [Oceanibacterium hippocampi]SLN26464.1 D-glycero-beta-D-manno-heptose-1,7-bisphosphate 7-phosphatase [Oceanibacterium hippocampi]